MRTSWHDYFLDIAKAASERSTCNRKKVGAVIVKNKVVLSTGYNGAPSGEKHCLDVGCDMVEGHCKRCVHAEVNAVAQAAKVGVSIDGAYCYSTLEPCNYCLMVMRNAGISLWHWKENYGID